MFIFKHIKTCIPPRIRKKLVKFGFGKKPFRLRYRKQVVENKIAVSENISPNCGLSKAALPHGS